MLEVKKTMLAGAVAGGVVGHMLAPKHPLAVVAGLAVGALAGKKADVKTGLLAGNIAGEGDADYGADFGAESKFSGKLKAKLTKKKVDKLPPAKQREASKEAIKETLKTDPPTTAERETFLAAQTPDGKKIFLEAETEVKSVQESKKGIQPKAIMLGLSAGAGLLLFLGAPLILPIAALGGAAYTYTKFKPGVMTPERKKIYEEALKSLKEPAKLRALADAFEKEAFPAEAELLRKRANLRELPADTQKARNVAFKAGLKSTNVHGVERLASAFEGEGATGAAEALRVHASALRAL